MAGKTAWKSATPQLSLVLPGAPASQFHSTAVEIGSRKARRAGSLIRQALYLDQEDAYAAGEVGFLARALVQATLPHSDPNANEFVRRNGHFTLSILAPKDVGLPYGRYPRLVLAYLTTEAVRRKSPDIELGGHFSHFCAALGIPPTTGPRGSLPLLRDQLQRLFASTFQCIFHDESQGRHAGDGFLIAEKRELWWDSRPGKDEAAWGSHVVLSDRFYREATEAPVPLDLRVLRALRSPFEIDIYVWLTWRFFRLRRPVTIPWASLALQFGCGYANPRHFKKRFLGYLKSVIDYYPEVRLESSGTGLVLKPSPTHIARRLGARRKSMP
ncbi:MAG: pirin [Thermoanaerobaculia bacterium]|nr:pirin [Thermoanaerobaculia bacterium]MBP9823531.1 pirin [Thermoanaerobaculia bacterium]